MALTRKLLKGMGLTEEQVDTIIEAHTDTVDGLKADLKTAQEGAASVSGLEKRIKGLEADLEAAKKDGWQEQYTKVKKEFDDYRQEQASKAARAAKEAAYRALLREAGVSEKRIDAVLRVSDVDAVELEDGKIKDAARLTEAVKEDWADFIVTTTTEGLRTPTPPAKLGGGYAGRDEIMKIKDPTQRQNAIAQHIDLFKKE